MTVLLARAVTSLFYPSSPRQFRHTGLLQATISIYYAPSPLSFALPCPLRSGPIRSHVLVYVRVSRSSTTRPSAPLRTNEACLSLPSPPIPSHSSLFRPVPVALAFFFYILPCFPYISTWLTRRFGCLLACLPACPPERSKSCGGAALRFDRPFSPQCGIDSSTICPAPSRCLEYGLTRSCESRHCSQRPTYSPGRRRLGMRWGLYFMD